MLLLESYASQTDGKYTLFISLNGKIYTLFQKRNAWKRYPLGRHTGSAQERRGGGGGSKQRKQLQLLSNYIVLPPVMVCIPVKFPLVITLTDSLSSKQTDSTAVYKLPKGPLVKYVSLQPTYFARITKEASGTDALGGTQLACDAPSTILTSISCTVILKNIQWICC